MVFDPFAFETGLLTGYIGVVTDAWFTFDPKYNNGQSLIMKWKMKTDNEQEPEWVESWPVGSDWRTLDNGKSAEHPKGSEKTFNRAAQFTKVVVKLVELGAVDQLKELGRFDPRVASFYLGLKVKMEQVEVGENMITKEKIVKNLPTEFYGVEGGGGQVTGGQTVITTPVESTTTTPFTTFTAQTNGAGLDVELSGIPVEIQQVIKGLASSLSHGQWVDAVLATPPVAQNLGVVMALSNPEGLYARLRG